MSPTPSSKRRSAVAVAANAELRALQMQLADLHSKRLNALRLYQSEKVLRQTESARADQLAEQLNKLRQQPSSSLPLNKLRTHYFDAQLRSVARIPSPSPMVSLTWHCLAMADAAVTAPDVLAVLQPTASCPADGALPSAQSAPTPKAAHLQHAATKDLAGATLTNVDTVCSLSDKLTAVSPQSISLSSDPDTAIDQLKSELSHSNSTCARLLATVKHQQQTIQTLSRYSA
ncbi:unnamed protein product [Agarophyton chilense]